MDKNEIRNLLAATVMAKVDYWNKLRLLEDAVAPDDDFTDAANDAVIDQIDMIAAGVEEDADIDQAHVEDLLKIIKDNP